jgi:energy-coupling factor transport system permease protein
MSTHSARYARFHPKAWGLWLLAALAAAVLTQNPFYLLVVILAAGLDYRSLGRASLTARHWGTFLRIGLALVLFSLLFNLLTANAGDTPLFTLPALRWTITSPDQQSALLQIGGTVTLEGLVYSLTSALGLMAVLTVFATFNTLVDHYQLLRSTPRFLYQSAIVASIAVTFVPQMVVAQREIREAQALRGHRFQGIRDLPPLFIALLTEGLERSITLAESMDARGFGGQPSEHPGRQELLLKSIIALALTVLASGAFAISYFPDKTIGRVIMGAGGLMLIAALWMVGQNVHRSRYRRDPWLPRDTLVAAASIITALVMLAAWLTQRMALVFYPFPQLHWPAFSPFIGLALLLLAMPALAARLTPGQEVSQEY